MPSYATAADVVSRYDIRRLSQFLSDTGTPVCTNAEISNGTCATNVMPLNTNLANLIKDASNKVLMSCRVANRYLQSDLDKIYADTDRRESLVRVVCDITWGYVMMRRGLGLREVSNLAPGFDEAIKTLQMLERGMLVFDDAAPDGTDAPLAGVEVETVLAPGGPNSRNPNSCGCNALWTAQVAPIFPGCGNGNYGGR